MRKLIKVLIYLDTEEEIQMADLVTDVKKQVLIINRLWEKYGLYSINVKATGFDRTNSVSNNEVIWRYVAPAE